MRRRPCTPRRVPLWGAARAHSLFLFCGIIGKPFNKNVSVVPTTARRAFFYFVICQTPYHRLRRATGQAPMSHYLVICHTNIELPITVTGSYALNHVYCSGECGRSALGVDACRKNVADTAIQPSDLLRAMKSRAFE